MRAKAQPYFDQFEQAARSEELGADSLLPGVLGSLDMEFEDVRATETRQDPTNNYLDANATDINRVSLGEKIESNRKKPSQSMEFAEFQKLKNERAF